MNTQRIQVAVARIERNERALKWLEEYGVQLNGDYDQFAFDARLKFATSVEGASDAAEMLGGYARQLLPELVKTSIQNCRNTIAMDKATIREEAST